MTQKNCYCILLNIKLVPPTSFLITTIFYSFLSPPSACPSTWRTQSVPSFPPVSSSSSLAPHTSFSSVPPPSQTCLTSVVEPGFALTKPTSLPSAPESGTGAGGNITFGGFFSPSSSHTCCNGLICVSPRAFPCFFCLPLFFSASWQSEWRPPKSQAPLVQPALSPKFLHPSANDPGQPVVLRKKQKIELPCNADCHLTHLTPGINFFLIKHLYYTTVGFVRMSAAYTIASVSI